MPVVYMTKESAATLVEQDIKKLIEKYSAEGQRYNKLENYYKGKHDILSYSKKDTSVPNNRLINNMAK